MKLSLKGSFLIGVTTNLLCFCGGIWTKFDLVRPFKAWGSNWTQPFTMIYPGVNNTLNVPLGAQFGFSVCDIEDFDGDGVHDLAVGAPMESFTVNGDTLSQSGAVYILLMTPEGNVKNHSKISLQDGNGPRTYSKDYFGWSITYLKDLDGDGVGDIAVGAPGYVVSAVHILYMTRDCTVKSSVLIRGIFTGNQANVNYSYIPNGPPISYLSKFGTSLAMIEDLNLDGVQDLAVGSVDQSSGDDKVYILFLHRNGTVKSYSTIGNGIGGGPILRISFSSFGSSLSYIGDLDSDNIQDIAIGAAQYDDGLDTNVQSGVVFICKMFRNGTVKSFSQLSIWAGQLTGNVLPWMQGDNCGAGITTIGDINNDTQRSQKPWLPHENYINPKTGLWQYRPITDMVVGCPSPTTGSGTGKIYLVFERSDGSQQGYREIPSITDTPRGIGPKLIAKDKFGASLAGYQDLDHNGIREVIVGSPGHNQDTGALYILFLRRRQFHPPVPDTFMYYFKIFFPLYCLFMCCCGSCCYFFWYFRRRPDEVEIAVLKSDIEIGKERPRVVRKKATDANQNDDEYPM